MFFYEFVHIHVEPNGPNVCMIYIQGLFSLIFKDIILISSACHLFGTAFSVFSVFNAAQLW